MGRNLDRKMSVKVSYSSISSPFDNHVHTGQGLIRQLIIDKPFNLLSDSGEGKLLLIKVVDLTVFFLAC